MESHQWLEKNEGLIALIKKEMSACGALQLMQYITTLSTITIYVQNLFVFKLIRKML